MVARSSTAMYSKQMTLILLNFAHVSRVFQNKTMLYLDACLDCLSCAFIFHPRIVRCRWVKAALKWKAHFVFFCFRAGARTARPSSIMTNRRMNLACIGGDRAILPWPCVSRQATANLAGPPCPHLVANLSPFMKAHSLAAATDITLGDLSQSNSNLPYVRRKAYSPNQRGCP